MAQLRNILPAAAGAVLAVSVSASSAPVDPGNAVYRVVLDKGMPNETELALYLDCRDGAFSRGFGLGPRFNRVPYDVDVSRLRVRGNAIEGEVAVTVHSDGYAPGNWGTLDLSYEISARITGTTVGGGYEGPRGLPPPKPKLRQAPARVPDDLPPALRAKLRPAAPAAEQEERKLEGNVGGNVAARTPLPSLFRLKLNMEAASGATKPGKSVWGTRGFGSITFKGGKPIQGLMRGHGGHPINYFEATVKDIGLEWGDGTLGGTLAVNDRRNEYEYAFEGIRIGDRVAGPFAKKFDGREAFGCRFTGRLAPVPDLSPGDCIYYMVLDNAVMETKQLMLHIPCRKGVFGSGVGFAGRFNHTYHDVDASGLRLEGDSLRGDLKITLNPDPYVPPDGKPVPCEYAIDTKVADACVSGTFSGRFRDTEVADAVTGELSELPPVPRNMRVNVKLDDGACGGAPWFRRCYVGFEARDGKAEGGGISNNKGGFKGTLKGSEVEFDGLTFKAVIRALIDRGSVNKGNYTFHLDGRAVGNDVFGKVDTELNGEMRKRGTAFMGSVGSLE